MIAALMVPAMLALPSGSEPVPVCETVQVQENPSGDPALNYQVRLCGPSDLDVSALIVDGAAFPERPTRGRVFVFWFRDA